MAVFTARTYIFVKGHVLRRGKVLAEPLPVSGLAALAVASQVFFSHRRGARRSPCLLRGEVFGRRDMSLWRGKAAAVDAQGDRHARHRHGTRASAPTCLAVVRLKGVELGAADKGGVARLDGGATFLERRAETVLHRNTYPCQS